MRSGYNYCDRICINKRSNNRLEQLEGTIEYTKKGNCIYRELGTTSIWQICGASEMKKPLLLAFISMRQAGTGSYAQNWRTPNPNPA